MNGHFMPTLSQILEWYSSSKFVFTACALPVVFSRPILKKLGINPESIDLMLNGLQGYLIGDLVSNIFISTGFETAIHEVMGHLILGCHMLYRYTNDNVPECVIPDIKKFQRILASPTLPEMYENFFSWLLGGTQGGGTYIGQPNGITKFGEYLGPEGRDAWFHITGSLPTLFLSTYNVNLGMNLRKSNPRLGWALIFFSLITNFSNSRYAWQAIGDSSCPPSVGVDSHDFIKFSKAISHITGLKESSIATATAAFMTFYIPLLTLYLYLKSKQVSPATGNTTHATNETVEKNQQKLGPTFFSTQGPVPSSDPGFERTPIIGFISNSSAAL